MDQNMNAQQGGSAATLDMKVDAIVYPVENQKNLLAFANVTINDSFVVTGVKVCSGKNGVFVDMPSAKDSFGEYQNVAFPVTKEFREQIVDAVLDNYQKALDGTQEQKTAAERPAADAPGMRIGVSVKPVESKKNIVALANVTLNKCFVVRDIKVCTGKNGLFVAMPSGKDGNGEFRDTVFPITKEFREQLFDKVIAGYEKMAEKLQAKEAAAEKKPSIIDGVKEKQKETAEHKAPETGMKKNRDEIGA